jgi:hypothetical protein
MAASKICMRRDIALINGLQSNDIYSTPFQHNFQNTSGHTHNTHTHTQRKYTCMHWTSTDLKFKILIVCCSPQRHRPCNRHRNHPTIAAPRLPPRSHTKGCQRIYYYTYSMHSSCACTYVLTCLILCVCMCCACMKELWHPYIHTHSNRELA